MESSATSSSIEWDPRDFVEERYPKRSRKNKIDDLSMLDDPEPEEFVNKAERLCKLPYPIEEILVDPRYEHEGTVLALPVSEFTMDYIRNSGLLRPLLFNVPPEQLGMRMPVPDEFTVSDVLELVGGERRIEVVEVYEQKGTYMLLKDFVDYYKKSPSERTKLLNVLSLEFTNSKLAEKVSAPAFVSEIDWIDNVWPKELFARQEDLLRRSAWARTNDFSTYPKVQRYCLMSVANCFTDFHIDFGGTSVWYHILRGEKIFWMIEPTEDNLDLYEQWILSGNDNSKFFGRLATKCSRIRLRQGDTLIIPSGWIHCVYTPIDSLVFGGNFLHSFSIPMQIRVSKSEDRIKIGSKYRFPHFKQMFWCFMAQIVRNATHRIYQKKLPEEAHNIENSTSSSSAAVAHKNDQSASELGKSSEEAAERAPTDGDALSDGSNATFVEANAEKCAGQDGQSAEDTNGRPMLRLNSAGEEICYDEFLGNAADGSFTFNPIQSVYENETEIPFTPTQHYDIDFLHSLPSLVVNGLFPLLQYAKRLLKSKQPEVIEGITRPRHLVKEFQTLLDKISELGLVSVQLESEFTQEHSEHVEFTVPAPKEAPVSLSLKQPPKDDKRKMKRHGAVEETVQKKALKKKNATITSTAANGPILVDGLPLPTHHLHTPSSSGGFNPMSEIVKLGQKPMQSAWRKASNMAKPPPPTHIQQLKKRFECSSASGNDAAEEGAGGQQPQNVPTVDDAAFTTQSTSDGAVFGKERKLGIHQRHCRKPIPKVAHNKLIEIHDDSPEFSHRSPLQRLRGHETAPNGPYNNSFQSGDRNAFHHPRSYSRNGNNNGTPRDRTFWHHQANGGFGNDQWSSNRGFGGGGRRNNNNSFSNYRPRSLPKNEYQTPPPYHPPPEPFSNTANEAHHFSSEYRNPPPYQPPPEPAVNESHFSSEYHNPTPYQPPPVPISNTVNELHHISQIMDAPSSVGLNDEINVDQIPLPPTERPSSVVANARSDQPQRTSSPAHQQQSADPFADVDELESITRMMMQ